MGCIDRLVERMMFTLSAGKRRSFFCDKYIWTCVHCKRVRMLLKGMKCDAVRVGKFNFRNRSGVWEWRR